MTNKEEQTSKRIKRNTVKYILKVQCVFSATFIRNCSQSSWKSSPNGLVIVVCWERRKERKAKIKETNRGNHRDRWAVLCTKSH